MGEESTQCLLRSSRMQTDRRISFFEEVKPTRVGTEASEPGSNSGERQYSIESPNLGDLLTGVKISKLLPRVNGHSNTTPMNLE